MLYYNYLFWFGFRVSGFGCGFPARSSIARQRKRSEKRNTPKGSLPSYGFSRPLQGLSLNLRPEGRIRQVRQRMNINPKQFPSAIFADFCARNICADAELATEEAGKGWSLFNLNRAYRVERDSQSCRHSNGIQLFRAIRG